MKRVSSILAAASVFALAACGQAGDTESDALGLTQSDEASIIIGSNSTFLKKTPADSSTLNLGSEKCVIPAGTKVLLQGEPSYEGSHFLVNTKALLPDCGFSKGYVFRAHVSHSSSKNLFPENVSAFLDTIGYAEGTGDRYDYMYTHKVFYGYAGHPRQIQCSYGLCSDAAGRYQFLSTTWDAMRKKLGLPDFSPESQDRAAVQLIKDVGCYSAVAAIDGPTTFSRAAHCVAGQWASFPGSPYGQPRHSASHLYGKYQQFLQRY